MTPTDPSSSPSIRGEAIPPLLDTQHSTIPSFHHSAAQPHPSPRPSTLENPEQAKRVERADPARSASPSSQPNTPPLQHSTTPREAPSSPLGTRHPAPGTLCIFGAGGHAKVVADIALQAGWGAIRFFADDYPQKTTLEHWPVEGDMAALIQQLPSIQGVIVAIGDCATRAQRQETLAQAGAQIVTLIHPTATISQFAKIGPGTVIVAGAIINAFAHIGQGCIINTAATIDHDCRIGNYVHISPGANISGSVTIGPRSWIGAGSVIRERIQIGSSVIVGAGAAVVKDVPDGVTVVGVPAKKAILVDCESRIDR